MNKFDEYLVPLKGEIEARLPEELVGTLRGLATSGNLHPVNVSKINKLFKILICKTKFSPFTDLQSKF